MYLYQVRIFVFVHFYMAIYIWCLLKMQGIKYSFEVRFHF